jgi:hypothetical protein
VLDLPNSAAQVFTTRNSISAARTCQPSRLRHIGGQAPFYEERQTFPDDRDHPVARVANRNLQD